MKIGSRTSQILRQSQKTSHHSNLPAGHIRPFVCPAHAMSIINLKRYLSRACNTTVLLLFWKAIHITSIRTHARLPGYPQDVSSRQEKRRFLMNSLLRSAYWTLLHWYAQRKRADFRMCHFPDTVPRRVEDVAGNLELQLKNRAVDLDYFSLV